MFICSSIIFCFDSEIEKLELVIMQQCESLEAVEHFISDVELETLESIFCEAILGAKQKTLARFTNDHQRLYEQRSRLRRIQLCHASREPQRDEQGRLTARLHKLIAMRAILLADLRFNDE
jgi:hypothetical protein